MPKARPEPRPQLRFPGRTSSKEHPIFLNAPRSALNELH